MRAEDHQANSDDMPGAAEKKAMWDCAAAVIDPWQPEALR